MSETCHRNITQPVGWDCMDYIHPVYFIKNAFIKNATSKNYERFSNDDVVTSLIHRREIKNATSWHLATFFIK